MDARCAIPESPFPTRRSCVGCGRESTMHCAPVATTETIAGTVTSRRWSRASWRHSMSHDRKPAAGLTHQRLLEIIDDDGDRLRVIKHVDRQSVVLEASNEWKDNHHGVSLNKSDANALFRF